jgi:uncharacterized membrane protein
MMFISARVFKSHNHVRQLALEIFSVRFTVTYLLTGSSRKTTG